MKSISTRILLWLAVGLLIIFSIKEFFTYEQLSHMQEKRVLDKSIEIKDTIFSFEKLYQDRFNNGSNHAFKQIAQELSKNQHTLVYFDKSIPQQGNFTQNSSNYLYQYPIKNQTSCTKCHSQNLIATLNIKTDKKPLFNELVAVIKQSFIISTILNFVFFFLIYIFVIRKVAKNIALFHKKFINFFDFLTEKRDKIEKVKINSGDEIEKFSKEIDNNITTTKNILMQKAKSEKELMKLNNSLQQKIDEATNYIATVIETSANAIIVIDEHSTILTFNDASQKLFGYSKQEMLNQNALYKIIPSNQMSRYENFINSFMKTKAKSTSTCDLMAKTKDNKNLFIHMALGSSKVHDKTILVLNITDVTKQKQNEKKIMELNRALDQKLQTTMVTNLKKDKIIQRQNSLAQMGEILSLIIDQLRQPVTAIGAISFGMQTKLKNDTSLSEETKNYFDDKLKKINTNTKYLSNVVKDFQNFYQPTIKPKNVPIDQVVQKAIHLISALLSTKEITLKTELQTNKKIITYPNELLQAILNILKNSVDALVANRIQNPTIEIKLYEQYEEFILEISDNALGIPQEIMDKIFNPYFSTKGEKIGTGLGLYVTKSIIQNRCHGSISVTNGIYGANFVIKLPQKLNHRVVEIAT